MKISGKIIQGYGVASGKGESKFPRGTIEMQKPFFARRGLDLSPFFLGTINISIAPHSYHIVKPRFHFEGVEWTELYPPENFSFFGCTLTLNGVTQDGLIYRPSPETKVSHFFDSHTLEILAPYVDEVAYGKEVFLEVDPNEIIFKQGRQNI